jgi:hypothetical protein
MIFALIAITFLQLDAICIYKYMKDSLLTKTGIIMVKKYQRFGLRRENNLSDVLDKDIALGNLLNNLASEGETFQPNDLRLSINGIHTTDVASIDLTDLANSTIAYFDENRIPNLVSPFVTIKDQIDNYKLISGSPPFLSGGDGPNAYFVEAGEIQSINANAKGEDLYSGQVENGPFSFWTNGVFSLPNYVFSDFPEQDGLIKWEGFFSPDININVNNFNVASTGLILVEVKINGNYETILNIYAGDREISYTSALTESVSSLEIGDQLKHVGIGDLVKEVNGVDISDDDITIVDVDLSAQTITLSDTIDLNSGSNTILFGFDVGDGFITSYFSINSLSIGQKIPIRIYNWWPTPVSVNTVSRDTVFRYSNVTTLFPYTYFYSQLPTSGEQLPESIEYFFNNYLQPKKRKTTEEVFVNDQIVIDYIPPTLKSQKILDERTISSQSGLELSSTNLFTNAEVGDYLYIDNPAGQKLYQINRVLGRSRVVVEGDQNTIGDLTGSSATLIDHMGLVGIYDITAGLEISEISGALFPLLDPNGYSLVRDDMLIANLSVSGTYFMRILNSTKNVSTVTVTTGDVLAPATITAGQVVVYRDKGLTDNSKLVFCEGVFAREVALQATSGATSLQLTFTDGTELNKFVQFSGPISSGTSVTAVNTSTNVITLSQSISATIVAGETITLSPDNVNREVCNIALNTAPPFEGTNRGLITVNGNEGIDASEIALDRLDMTISGVASTSGTSYTQTLDVNHNGSIYKILIV